MNVNVFYEELSNNYRQYGKLAVSNKYPSDHSSTLYDIIRMKEEILIGVEFRITGLYAPKQKVIVDVEGFLAMEYVLGTKTTDILRKAISHYASLPQTLDRIRQNATLIYNANEVAIAYDKAAVLFNQYISTGSIDAILLTEAWKEITRIQFHNLKSKDLSAAIQKTAKQHDITLQGN